MPKRPAPKSRPARRPAPAAKAKPRRRAAAPIHWAPWLWSGFAASTLAGLIWSPITSPVVLRVDGSMPSDRAAITEALESLKGTPALQVNHAKLANRLLLRDQIDRVELSLNLFGRGRLRVVHRIPVARLAGPEPGMALSREGVVFRSDAVMDDLPLLTPPASAWKFGASVADSWECLAAASLAESVRGTLPPEPWRIQVDQRSTVSLSLPGKAVVRLGSTSDMDAKLRAFLDALNANPELMQKAREINFSAPSNPVYIP